MHRNRMKNLLSLSSLQNIAWRYLYKHPLHELGGEKSEQTIARSSSICSAHTFLPLTPSS